MKTCYEYDEELKVPIRISSKILQERGWIRCRNEKC